MSGLAVLFHRDGRPVDEHEIWSMLQAIPYRGPDGMFCHVMGAIALGHAKMAVTPEEQHEQQPIVSPRTGCVIIADVRLDNREDILNQLPTRLTNSISDTELILWAYEVWDTDGVVRLLGDFAFVIWDLRKQRIVCGRDTSGQRALYYRTNHRTFAAASEIQQLFQDPEVPIEPNEEHIKHFLTPRNIYSNEKQHAMTFFEGIFALPAGHVLLCDQSGIRIVRFWDLEPPEELRYRRNDEYAEHFRELFFEVVRTRLRSSRTIGALLSGGLDSSSIVCTAQDLYRSGRVQNRGFISFSSVFDGLDADERNLIMDVQAKYGFDARYVPFGEPGGRLQLEPRGFMEAPNMGIAEARDTLLGVVSDAGVRVLLNGNIADACIGGSGIVFDSLLKQGRFLDFARYFRAYRRNARERLPTTILFGCIAPLLPLPLHRYLRVAYAGRRIHHGPFPYIPEWLSPSLRDELRSINNALYLEAEKSRRFRSQVREQEYRRLYPPEVARHVVPWSLEMWSPFADRRLHEFLLAVPPEQKYEPHPASFYAGTKQLIRRGFHGILPESIRTRTNKTFFQSANESEFKRHWPVYASVFGPTGNAELYERSYVERTAFWSRLQAAHEGTAGLDETYLRVMAGLETWLRTFKLPRPQQIVVPPPWGQEIV